VSRALMVQGTTSNAGKSVLVTALCRVFRQDGYRVAPFKAQNMSLNAYVTADGGEIGRAQGVQAEAAGTVATVDMNPVLLKPKADSVAQVIILGRPVGDFTAQDYREDCLGRAWQAVRESYARLSKDYDVVVIEGAGSPAEVNLREKDIANMRVAALAEAPVLLVADIDRGGVFAQVVGTLALLLPEEAARVRGVVINKFRGDLGILAPGLRFLEERTGRPVLGVLPFLADLGVAAEDSVSLNAGFVRPDAALDIVVVRLPRIANFDDFDPLLAEPDVSLRFVSHPRYLGQPDLLVLPGTKNTVADLRWLNTTGWAAVIREWAAAGMPLLGVCGGYQMLGREIQDPNGLEDEAGIYAGLGLLDVVTVFRPEKVTVRQAGFVLEAGILAPLAGERVFGYEIHAGETFRGADAAPIFTLVAPGGSTTEGAVAGTIWGTYLHGLFEADGFRRGFLNLLRRRRGLPPVDYGVSFARLKERSFDRLAAVIREHLNLREIYRWLGL